MRDLPGDFTGLDPWYGAAPAEAIGAAGRLFQTCRYVDAILPAGLIGLIFQRAGTTTPALHRLARS